MYPTYKPFKIIFNPDGLVSHLIFKEADPLWSTNFKRAIAAMLQFQVKKSGAFVVNEVKLLNLFYYIIIINNFNHKKRQFLMLAGQSDAKLGALVSFFIINSFN